MNVYDMTSPRLLEEDMIPYIVGYYYRNFSKPYIMDTHKHKQIEIMYVEQGICDVQIQNNIFHMVKGEFVLINGEVSHRLIVQNEQNSKIINIEFVFVPNAGEFFPFGDFYKKVIKKWAKIFSDTSYYVLKDSEGIDWVLKKIVTELNAKGGTTGISTNLLFWQLILQISKIVKEEYIIKNNPQAGYIKKAIQIIYDHYNRDIKIEDIANEIGLERSYFHRIFKEYTGMTPRAYLVNARINRAKSMLLNTNLPIIEIANAVGINSQQYFNQIFKKVTGMSPGELRKEFEIEKLQY